MKFTFRLTFFLLAAILFIIEILIALYVRDRFIRPYLGDFLVVIMLYCGVRSFVNASPLKIALAVLLFACTIEAFQYFHFVDRLGLSGNRLARTVIGYGFEWLDMLAYTLGIITVLILENFNINRKWATTPSK
jgi:hypothetical protein